MLAATGRRINIDKLDTCPETVLGLLSTCCCTLFIWGILIPIFDFGGLQWIASWEGKRAILYPEASRRECVDALQHSFVTPAQAFAAADSDSSGDVSKPEWRAFAAGLNQRLSLDALPTMRVMPCFQKFDELASGEAFQDASFYHVIGSKYHWTGSTTAALLRMELAKKYGSMTEACHKVLDGNGDGTVTLAEFRNGTSTLDDAPSDTDAVRLFEHMDTDADGLLSMPECHFKAIGFKLRLKNTYGNLSSGCPALDSDKNGQIEEDEFLAGAKLLVPPIEGVDAGALFPQLDADADGAISVVPECHVDLAEFQKRVAASRKKLNMSDADKGYTLSAAEFTAIGPQLVPPVDAADMAELWNYFDRDHDGATELGELWLPAALTTNATRSAAPPALSASTTSAAPPPVSEETIVSTAPPASSAVTSAKFMQTSTVAPEATTATTTTLLEAGEHAPEVAVFSSSGTTPKTMKTVTKETVVTQMITTIESTKVTTATVTTTRTNTRAGGTTSNAGTPAAAVSSTAAAAIATTTAAATSTVVATTPLAATTPIAAIAATSPVPAAPRAAASSAALKLSESQLLSYEGKPAFCDGFTEIALEPNAFESPHLWPADTEVGEQIRPIFQSVFETFTKSDVTIAAVTVGTLPQLAGLELGGGAGTAAGAAKGVNVTWTARFPDGGYVMEHVKEWGHELLSKLSAQMFAANLPWAPLVTVGEWSKLTYHYYGPTSTEATGDILMQFTGKRRGASVNQDGTPAFKVNQGLPSVRVSAK